MACGWSRSFHAKLERKLGALMTALDQTYACLRPLFAGYVSSGVAGMSNLKSYRLVHADNSWRLQEQSSRSERVTESRPPPQDQTGMMSFRASLAAAVHQDAHLRTTFAGEPP